MLTKVVATLAVAAATVAGVDLALRAVGYMPAVSHPWHFDSDRSRYRVRDDRVILVRPELLDIEYYRADPGHSTVVALGDSFTQGHRLEPEDSYPAALERVLRDEGWDVNVVNAGVGNSGPDQHLRLLEEIVLPIVRPDVVLWQLYPNDIGDVLRLSVSGIEGDRLVPWDARDHWLYQRLRLFESLPLPHAVKAESPLLRVVFKAMEARGDRRLPSGDWAQLRAWGTQKIRLAIERLERLASEIGFETYYVLIAPQSFYLESKASSRGSDRAREDYRILRSALGERPDVIDAWFGAGQPGSPQSEGTLLFEDAERDDNALGDRHFNASGYQRLARAVASRLLIDRQGRQQH